MVVEDKFRKDVTIKISPIERSEYAPPRGIEVRWYPYQDPNKEYCNATFLATAAAPNPEEIRDMNDINAELTKLRVIQDGLTERDEPLLVKNFGIGIHALVDTPVFDGERDHYRSKLKEEQVIPVRKDIVDQMNKDFERKAPILPTTKRKYSFHDKHVAKIDGTDYVMMRFARIM